MSTETGTVLLTSLVPPAAMGLIVGKKHLNGSRKGRWKHIFSADDGRGSSMKIPLHSWTSVRSCDWCMTHCCVLCAEWPRKRQVSGPWTHGTGVWKMVETKGFLERTTFKSPKLSHFFQCAHSHIQLVRGRSVLLCGAMLQQRLQAFKLFPELSDTMVTASGKEGDWRQSIGYNLQCNSLVLEISSSSNTKLGVNQSCQHQKLPQIRETSSGSETLAIKIKVYISLWNSSIQEDT